MATSRAAVGVSVRAAETIEPVGQIEGGGHGEIGREAEQGASD